MPRAPQYPVPAMEKGLDLLEALSSAAVPMSLAELATRLNRSSSELFRMLNCLERRSYIARDPASGRYRLSLKLFALAHAHSPTDQLLWAARRPMQALTERFRESCHLSVLDHGRLLVIAQEDSPERVRISIEVGGVFDPAHTASGRLLLAFPPTDGAAGAAPRPAPPLARSLAKIRRDGVSTAESETVEGVRDVAVPVGTQGSGVMAALAVTRLLRRTQRDDEAALINGMRETALEITRALGLAA